MGKRIVIVQGHPDPGGDRYGHALAEAYRQGAREAGHEVEILPVAELDFPLLRTKRDFDDGEAPEAIRRCQQAILAADHLVIIHPLWLGSMPALLKGFLEQVFRPIHRSLIGMVEARDARGRHKRLAEVRRLGRQAA
jgi:putative NADPH-quinone reductase